MVTQSFGVRKGEGRRFNRFERKVDTGDLLVRSTQRPEDQEVVFGFGQNHPLPAPRFHQRSDSKAHDTLPKTWG